MRAEYIDHMGTDLTVVNAARVSFDKESDWEWPSHGGSLVCDTNGNPLNGELVKQDSKLIKYLAEHNHWTPFSHCMVTLRETVPIFVARQRFKHTVGFTYNEISRRYVDSTPEFFIPENNRWRTKAENKKQGSSDETIPINPVLMHEYYDQCLQLYGKLLDTGVAPEQARMVLPQSMYTSYYVTGSLAAWSRAFKLRYSKDAQSEIRDLAVQWDKIIGPLFPESWIALNA